MLIVLIALLFLAGDYGYVSERTVTVGWPVLVGLIGLNKLAKGWCKCCMNDH